MSHNSLLAWLTSVGLEKHHDTLSAEGIDLDVVASLNDEDLRSLGFNLGDRRRFLRGMDNATSFAANPMEKPEEELEIERRQVTVLFCDLVGSTALSNSLDDETFAQVVREYSLACGRAIESVGGRVAKFMGDGVMGYFGYPHASGDEARRAIEAGFLMQNAVVSIDARYEASVQARVGIASGSAIIGEVVGDHIDALGDTPNLAARVEAKAVVGTVTVAPLTRRLADGLFEFRWSGDFELKGFDEPVALHEVIRPLDPTAAFFDHPEHTIVGRDLERAEIQRLRRSIVERPVMVRIGGEPGIGKSSLLSAAIDDARAEDWRVYVLRCSEHETAIPLHPVRRLLEWAAGIDIRSSDTDRLEAVAALAESIGRLDIVPAARRLLSLGADDGKTPAEVRAEIFDLAISMVIEALSIGHSMLVIEDLQWCDPSSFELFEELLEKIGDSPAFVVVTERSGLGEFDGRLRADSIIRLEPFDDKRSRLLVESITTYPVSDEIVSTIRKRAGGVPLYMVELTRSLIEASAIIEGQNDLAVEAGAVPDTLQDSLQARLDRLPNGRDVAPVAAAIGLDFSLSLLHAAAPDGLEINRAVWELQRARLITADGDRASFCHEMIRTVAYQRLLRDHRESIHGRIGDVLVDAFSDRAASEPHVVARHLSLGPEPGRSVEWWYEAAQAHAQISANHEVISNVDAGLGVLEHMSADDDRDRSELKLQLLRAGTLRATHGFAAEIVGSVYDRAVDLSTALGDLDSMSAALNGTYSYHLVRDHYAEAGRVARLLLETANASEDARRKVIANRAVGVVDFHIGQFVTAEEHLRESIRLYHAGDFREDAWLIGTDHATTAGSFLAMNELVSGLGDANATIDEAEAYADEIDHLISWAQVITYRGFMAVIARDWPEAHRAGDLLLARLGDRTIPLMQATGRFWSAAGRFHLGEHEALSDLWAAAEAWWATGARSYAGYVRSVIAEAEGIVGRPGDGLATVAESFTIIAQNDERWSLAECHRVASDLYRLVGDSARAEIERAKAQSVASEQGATLWLDRAGG